MPHPWEPDSSPSPHGVGECLGWGSLKPGNGQCPYAGHRALWFVQRLLGGLWVRGPDGQVSAVPDSPESPSGPAAPGCLGPPGTSVFHCRVACHPLMTSVWGPVWLSLGRPCLGIHLQIRGPGPGPHPWPPGAAPSVPPQHPQGLEIHRITVSTVFTHICPPGLPPCALY